MFFTRNAVLQENLCGMRFLCCCAVARKLNLNERLAVFAYFEAERGLFRP